MERKRDIDMICEQFLDTYDYITGFDICVGTEAPRSDDMRNSITVLEIDLKCRKKRCICVSIR